MDPVIDKRSFMLGGAALAAALALPARAQTPVPAVRPLAYPHRVVTVVTHYTVRGDRLWLSWPEC